MKAKYAREIRMGIVLAKQVIAGKRRHPRTLVSFGHRGAPEMPLWQRAYHREFLRAVHDGRIRPPHGPSGASDIGR